MGTNQAAELALAAALLTGMGACVAAVRPLMYRSGWSGSTVRRLSHIVCGVLAAIGLTVIEDPWLPVVAGLIAAGGFALAVERGWIVDMLVGTRLRDYGFVMYGLGFAATAYLFLPRQDVVIGAVVTLALCDPAASFIGERYGRRVFRLGDFRKTLEGSLAFAGLAFAIAMVFLAAHGYTFWHAVGVALFIAASTAALEACVPSFADNAVIPIWAGWLYSQALVPQATAQWPAAVIVVLTGVPVILRLGWLDPAGTMLAGLIALVTLGLGGPRWFVPVFLFLASSSILTKLRQKDLEATRPRRAKQTMINGAVPLLPLAGYLWNGSPVWYLASVAAVAVACADTWATEIGRHSSRQPVSIIGFQRVAAGTSGGITWLGIVGGLLGAAVIAAAAALFVASDDALPVFVAVTAIGFAGMLFDSALGAIAQRKSTCIVCGTIFEDDAHCGRVGNLVTGFRAIDNDAVNLLANLAGIANGLLVAAQLTWS